MIVIRVEINDEGHAVVKNIKDSNGEWVKKEEKTEENNSEVERIAALTHGIRPPC